ncbi:hypothetical protein [Microvirga solisilvae]|uniref:hypothetical protein n=1 Tax=Microvirga solisilvae TaxID=2919498 RepID=UPI001FB02321|nr:hypothetical protein [Microvirga solisilvae]
MRKAVSSAIALLILAEALAAGSAARAETGCHESSDYLVVERSRDDGFADFLVRKKTASSTRIACAFSPQPKDFRPKESKPYGFSFVALSGRHLALEISDTNGTQVPRVRIYDLDKQSVLQDIEDVFEIGEEASEKGFDFWVGSKTEPTKENCPDYAEEIGAESSESQIVLLQKATFDFASLKVVDSTEMKCVSWAD